MKVQIVDPPSGWRYGFPCELPDGASYEQLLRDHKYPEEDIEFALKHSGYWTKEIERDSE